MIVIVIVIFALVTTLFAGWRAWRRLRYFLHIFQLEGYKPDEFVRWIRQRAGRILFRLSHKLAVAELAIGFFGFFYWSPYWTAVILLPLWSITFASSRLYRSDQQKKPLKYTNRLQRLLAAAAMMAALPVVLGFIYWTTTGIENLFYYLLGFFAADLLAPLWVLLAAHLIKPVETSIQERFKRRARRRLQSRPDVKIIGITGSYGKTSTKFIIDEILRQRYNVLASPASYNTPMGLCIVINEMVKPEHQVLVLEMGIRHHGDMHELCAIAHPDVAVVTSVGMAHLETMGSIEAITREKSQILTCMERGGVAILNADDPRVNSMESSTSGKVWKVSAKGSIEADITAHNISYGPEGAQFTVRDDTGDERTFKTKLLGEHNVLNILLGVAVGRELDVRLRQIAYAVERLEPIEHRLQLRQQGQITIIDDAFNSNPVGARNALEILGRFNSGRRIVITPGMIELGDHQYEENKRLGEHIADHVDLALLVGGEQTRPIQDGLKAKHFPAEKWKVLGSFFEAQNFLRTYLQPGDVVLYENDLPDQYNE
jgi:UDP-N-acetylmuramoyl-tripeptide--D-alanyl-D-alanine ligase